MTTSHISPCANGRPNSVKLYFFDFPGRAEQIRLALAYAGVEFEDIRLSKQEFEEGKASGKYSFHQLPVLDIDGKIISQADAMLRFAGRLGGTYPTDPVLALKIDEVTEMLNDLSDRSVSALDLPDHLKAEVRAKLTDVDFPKILTKLEKILESSESGFLFGSSVSTVDFKLFGLYETVKLGIFNYISRHAFDKYPRILRLVSLVRSLPPLAAYFEKRRAYLIRLVDSAEGTRAGEQCRLAFIYGGVAFEDTRISEETATFALKHHHMHMLPVLDTDGQILSQPYSMLRYAGRLGGTYPQDPFEAFCVDELLGILSDISFNVVHPNDVPKDVKRTMRLDYLSKRFPTQIRLLAEKLASSSSGWLLPEKSTPTIADFALYCFVDGVMSEDFEDIPPSALSDYPALLDHRQRVLALPQIASHFEARKLGIPKVLATCGKERCLPKLKLTFYSIFDGPALNIRLCFEYAKIPFEDERISYTEFQTRVAEGKVPYGQLPILEVDGEVISQKNAILRYAGHLAGLIPHDARAALKMDEILCAIDELIGKMVWTLKMPERDRNIIAEHIVNSDIPFFFHAFENQLDCCSSGFLVGGSETIADIKLYSLVDAIKKGVFTMIVPPSLVDDFPDIMDHYLRVQSIPQLAHLNLAQDNGQPPKQFDFSNLKDEPIAKLFASKYAQDETMSSCTPPLNTEK